MSEKEKRPVSVGSTLQTDKTNIVPTNNVSTEISKSQHGGARKGAGRKSKDSVSEDALTIYNLVFHKDLTVLSKDQCAYWSKLASIKSATNYWAVIYPDSQYTPENWLDIARSWLIPMHVIFHDKDCDEDTGEIKKPHYHVILMFPDKQTPVKVCELWHEIGGIPDRMPILNRAGACRYLIHRDHPHKYQYEISDVASFNGADYFSDISCDVELYSLMLEIERHIYKYRTAIRSYATLSRWCAANKPEWYRVVCTHSYHYTSIYKSLKYDVQSEEEVAYAMYLIDQEEEEKARIAATNSNPLLQFGNEVEE